MSKIALLILAAFFITASLFSPAKAEEDNYLIVKDLRVLIVVYRGPLDAEPNGRIDKNELGLIKGAIDCGRLFYFRNTAGTLNLTISYKLIDTVAPDNGGPTYDNIVADLRERGVVDNQFDGVYTTGIGMGGNWGGFTIFDRSGAAFGGGSDGGRLSQFPSADKTVGYDWAWTFVHEFQHALDLSIAGNAGFGEFVHGHPYADSTEHPGRILENPGSQHWDWEACTLRNFKHYLQIPGATSSYIYALDSDGDGLADRHPSLPMDEERFGTDPNNKDTDNDGLSDLDEFTADIYLGSSPLDNDTDRDGMPDGLDMWPTVAISPSIGYASPTPVIDGELDGVYSQLIDRWYATNWEDLDRNAVETYACWDEENLYLVARAPADFDLSVQIDTSAHNGFWEGGDTYIWKVKNQGKPSISIPKHAEWPGSQTVWSKDDAGNTVVEMALPVMLGQGWSREANFGGPRLPEDVADGLVLLDGRAVSFNVIFDFPGEKKRVLLTPTWTMISSRLGKDSRDPDLPILRFSESMQESEKPIIRVDGIGAKTEVSINSSDGKQLGKGVGSGPIELSGVRVGSDRTSGKNVLVATTSTGKSSKPFELFIDTSSTQPDIKTVPADEGKSGIEISGEGGAIVALEFEVESGKWVSMASAVLDEKGSGVIEIDPTFKGFRGEYFDTEVWTEPVMQRIDPTIDFFYKAGSPMKIMSPETFSVRWTGFLEITKTTKATFFLTCDDGSRLYIDGDVVVDHWGHHGKSEKSGEITLKPGMHELKIDYYEEDGWAAAHLEWQPEGGERTFDIPVTAFRNVPKKKMFRAIQIDVLGNESEASKEVSIK